MSLSVLLSLQRTAESRSYLSKLHSRLVRSQSEYVSWLSGLQRTVTGLNTKPTQPLLPSPAPTSTTGCGSIGHEFASWLPCQQNSALRHVPQSSPALHPEPGPTPRLGERPTHSKAVFFPQSLPAKPCRLLPMWVCFTLLHILILGRTTLGLCVAHLFLKTQGTCFPDLLCTMDMQAAGFTWTSTGGSDTCLLDIPGVSVFHISLSCWAVCLGPQHPPSS